MATPGTRSSDPAQRLPRAERAASRALSAVLLSVLIHALVLAGVILLAEPTPPPPRAFPVELVPRPELALSAAPHRPAPKPALVASEREKPVRRSTPPRRVIRRLERSNPNPASATSAADPGRALLASAAEPGEGGANGGGGSWSGGAASPGPGGGAPPAPTPPPSSLASAPPRVLDSPPPAYPRTARRRHAEGLVLVRARVGREGRVQAAELARSSGAEDLDQAALVAVRAWRFQPGTRGSSPVEAWVNVPVRFRLER